MVLTLRLSVLYGLYGPYETLTEWYCITEVESVYCAVRTEFLYRVSLSLEAPNYCLYRVSLSLEAPNYYLYRVSLSLEAPNYCLYRVSLSLEAPNYCL